MDISMRKIVVLSFITLDGVVQGPGGPEEDTSGGFTYGGWVTPYFDKALGEIMGKQMSGRSDLLLGRKTHEIFAAYWPQHEADWPGINDITKYVVSETLTAPEWKNTTVLKNAEEIAALKQQEGSDLQVHGSSHLIQTLLSHDLVDELWLKIFPVTVGAGKRLFGSGTMPKAFRLVDTTTTTSGVIVASYTRDGTIRTGSFS